IVAKDPTSIEFNAFLIKHGYNQASLPLQVWDTDSLTLSALFFHSKLDIAKQQLALAKLSVQTAGAKPLPTLNADIARTNQANEDIRPWSYGLTIDIPIQTNNKRSYKIKKAEKNVDIAQLDLAETAWQLRSQIADDLIAYHQSQAEITLLEEELSVQNNIVNMLQKRFDIGMVSSTELSRARLNALKSLNQFKNKQALSQQLEIRLASDAGLTVEQFSQINIKNLSLAETLAHQKAALQNEFKYETLKEQALLNRIDLRRRMAQYNAAEIEIKLQAAKQIPDIRLSPGILFEFGDKIWSLGFSSLLNMLKQNPTLIEEAKQLRAIEGAAFEDLQADIIATVARTQSEYQAAEQNTEQAIKTLHNQQDIADKMQQQFNNGLIGKLDLAGYQLNTVAAKQQLLASQFAQLKAANALENAMHKPLYSKFKMPLQPQVSVNDDQ
ncbi:MAG TPA: TolC family protein, partial [Methylophilaceae bacterium]|nr:TolC family protein [Methylophilaceae bacterium]